ncbi:MAG: hypothetical protein WAN47_01960 [Nitrosotalea sp.]
MNLTPIILSILLAGSALGYGMQASAQNPCTASQPCAPICGNHPCAPGETYTPGMVPNANQTGMPNITNQLSASANATAMLHHHGNMTGYMGNGTMQGNMTGMHMHHNGNMTGTMANGTMTGNMANGAMAGNMNSMPMTSSMPSPNAQVNAGTQPANVKCMSGFSLVISNSNPRPACVTQSTASLLEARGWGHAAA